MASGRFGKDDPLVTVVLSKPQCLSVVYTLDVAKSFSSFSHQPSVTDARDMILGLHAGSSLLQGKARAKCNVDAADHFALPFQNRRIAA